MMSVVDNELRTPRRGWVVPLAREEASLERPASPGVDKATKEGRSSRARGAWRRARRLIAAVLIAVAVAAALRFTVFRPPLVYVAEVKRADAVAEVEGTGTVTADAVANVASKITGRVERVFVDEADVVQQGQFVATLDQTDLRRQVDKARAQLVSAQENARELRRESERREHLLAIQSPATSPEITQQYQNRDAVAQSVIQAAQADLGYAEYNLSLTQIPSLSSGLVIKRWVVPGASVVPGQPMFTIADTNLIYVNTYIDQNFTGKIRKGEAASVILRGREDQPLLGHVLRINPQADQGTEEMVAEVTFNLPIEQFQLGQWANVYVQVGEAKDALVVPRTALVSMQNETSVFVVDATDRIRQETVIVLASSPRRPMVAVAGHLGPGDHVVLMPAGLRTGQTVRPTPVKEAQGAEPT